MPRAFPNLYRGPETNPMMFGDWLDDVLSEGTRLTAKTLPPEWLEILRQEWRSGAFPSQGAERLFWLAQGYADVPVDDDPFYVSDPVLS